VTDVAMRRLQGILAAVVATVLLGASAAAVTYESVDQLPEPDLVLTDRMGDLVYGSAGSWEDIREVWVFVEEAFLAFAITCRGSAPRGGMLFVLLDMDGNAGPISTRGGVNRDDVRRAGYEFELGLVHDDEGLYRVRDGTPRSVATVGHWSERGTAYYEVAWEDLGGRPEGTIDFMVLTFGTGHDVAPNHGSAEIPAELVGGAAALSYEQLTLIDIEAAVADLSTEKINSSQDERNEMPDGTVLIFRTDEGRLGKMRILDNTAPYELVFEYVMFDEDGTVLWERPRATVRATYGFDLETGAQIPEGEDLWWEHTEFHGGGQPGDPVYLVPVNGALFAVYAPASG